MTYTLKTFEDDLRLVLNHLYDPAYANQIEKLSPVFGCPGQVDRVQEAIRQAINELRPLDTVPASARSWRVYHILNDRYIHQLTQKETAEKLSVTIRHLRREQNLAIHILAESVYHNAHKSTIEIQTDQVEGVSEPYSINVDWPAQVQSDLDALQKGGFRITCRLNEVLTKVYTLVESLATRHGIEVVFPYLQDDLMIEAPPATVQQILIQCLMEMIRHILNGKISLEASEFQEQIQIRIMGQPAQIAQEFEYHLIGELVHSLEGFFYVQQEKDQILFEVRLPTDRINVLVVDDNLQLTTLYQRYVQGTRYKVHVIHQGAHIFEIIETIEPDIILLDAMLPDVDGWELLAHLHAHPDTSLIPIIVCSVVREEELALELGASLYLPKPVRRQQFLQALDSVAVNVV
jgi:CheY-like chemotaxis protein